ncbi:MAG: hypothetical protein ACRD6R_03165 [Candidatus Polarisedimenticolia bacterium]
MKYRQPGYRDDEYKDQKDRQRRDDRGPRGPRGPRGMEREAAVVTRCHQCGHQAPAPESLPTSALCPKCRAAMHCCRNCVHFDPGARFECKQPIPKRLLSKTAANICDLFRPETVLDATGRRIAAPAGASPGAPAGKPVSPGRAAFEALFKKK